MIKRTLALTAAVLGCMVAPSYAAALQVATITEVVPFSILAPLASNFPPQTVTISTPQFNPALGTLVSAATTITGVASSDLEFFSTGAGGLFDVILSDALSFAVFGQELTSTLPANQAVFNFPVTIPFGPLDKTDPIAAIVGTGTWDQLFSLPYPSLAVKRSPASVLVPGLSLAATSLTSYTYKLAIAAVPEPRLVSIPGMLILVIVVALTKD
jgi:hypothetical protein